MSYVQLTSEERYVIYPLKLFKLKLARNCTPTGSPPHYTTISREIQCNGPEPIKGGNLLAVCVGVTERRKQHRYGTGRISIDERPDLVAARERFGDWGGDTVEGVKGNGHIIPHVERKSRHMDRSQACQQDGGGEGGCDSPLHSGEYQNVTKHADAG